MRKFTLLFVVLVASMFFVGQAASSTPKLSVSPATPSVGDNMVFAGCGYTPSNQVQVQVLFNSKTAEVIDQVDETVDANGCISTSATPFTALYSGKWVANVFEFNTGHKDTTLNFFVS